MASEALVDLSYRGLVLGQRVRLLGVGPRSAYVAHDAPMPVGTELILTVDDTLRIPAQVARVREGDSKDGPAGMWLWADAAGERARAWWDAHVTADDPRIPEPASGSMRVEAPVAPAPASDPPAADEPAGHDADETGESHEEARSDASDTAQELPAMALSLAAAGDDPGDPGPDAADDARDDVQAEARDGAQDDDEDEYAVEIGRAATNAGLVADAGDAEADADARALERRRHGRGTAVMTAVEIADVLGMPPVLDGYVDAGPAEPEDGQPQPRSTHVMSAVEVEGVLAGGGAAEPAPQDDGSARGKGRKRRGRKRR